MDSGSDLRTFMRVALLSFETRTIYNFETSRDFNDSKQSLNFVLTLFIDNMYIVVEMSKYVREYIVSKYC